VGKYLCISSFRLILIDQSKYYKTAHVGKYFFLHNQMVMLNFLVLFFKINSQAEIELFIEYKHFFIFISD